MVPSPVAADLRAASLDTSIASKFSSCWLAHCDLRGALGQIRGRPQEGLAAGRKTLPRPRATPCNVPHRGLSLLVQSAQSEGIGVVWR